MEGVSGGDPPRRALQEPGGGPAPVQRRRCRRPGPARPHPGPGGRGSRRSGRFCSGHLPAGGAPGDGAHHPAGPGGQQHRWKGRGEPSPGEKSDRRLLPAPAGGSGPGAYGFPAAAAVPGRPGGNGQVRDCLGCRTLCPPGAAAGGAAPGTGGAAGGSYRKGRPRQGEGGGAG